MGECGAIAPDPCVIVMNQQAEAKSTQRAAGDGRMGHPSLRNETKQPSSTSAASRMGHGSPWKQDKP